MTLFWLIAAGLAVAVLAWLLRPLLSRGHAAVPSRSAANVSIYRDQLRELGVDLAAGTLAREDYERARAELEARMLQDVAQPDVKPAAATGRRAAWALGAAVPVLAAAVYFAVGSPGAIDRPPEPERHASAAQVAAMVERLAARLRENPDDVDGWRLLGRSYSVMGRFNEAADAYAKAAARAPRDAALLADFADVLAMARGRRLQGEPEQLALRALEIEPGNLKALALAGTAAFERKDYAGAAAHWERMLPHVAPDSDDARAIQRNVAEARALSGQKVEQAGKQEKKGPVAAAALRGTVTLSPKVKDRASPDDTVFVFARAAEGPPMPLAVARVRVRDLPYRFSLDDSMAMTPQLKLSAFPKVVVTARISKTGNATAQPGDLQGASVPVSNNAGAVAVVIDGFVR